MVYKVHVVSKVVMQSYDVVPCGHFTNALKGALTANVTKPFKEPCP